MMSPLLSVDQFGDQRPPTLARLVLASADFRAAFSRCGKPGKAFAVR